MRNKTVLGEKDLTLLKALAQKKTWVRPLDIGGHSRSSHSRLLLKLCASGYVEKYHRSAAYSRASYVYRITDAGRDLLKI